MIVYKFDPAGHFYTADTHTGIVVFHHRHTDIAIAATRRSQRLSVARRVMAGYTDRKPLKRQTAADVKRLKWIVGTGRYSDWQAALRRSHARRVDRILGAPTHDES